MKLGWDFWFVVSECFFCYSQSCYQAARWNVHLAENGLKTALIKGDTWRHSDVKDSFKGIGKHCHSVTSVCQPWQDACAHVQKHWSPAVVTVFHRSPTWRTCFPTFLLKQSSHFITIPLAKGHQIDSCSKTRARMPDLDLCAHRSTGAAPLFSSKRFI